MSVRLAALLALALSAAPAAALDPLPPAAGRDPAAERLASASAALDRDRRSPRGLAALAELDALSDDLPELARLAAVYARAADDRQAHPEVRALARYRLGMLEQSRGNLQRTQAHLARLGFVTGWQVVGPFDDEGKRGFDQPFPPEERIELGARYPGKARQVAWRSLPQDALVQGFVHLGAALRPAREVVAYALAVVESPRDERVELWLGASGAAKVFVNGALALSDATHHPARLDQRGATVSLRKGANRILVKLCHQDGKMGFFLRLAELGGEGRTLAAADPASPAVAPGSAPAPIPDALLALERRVEKAGGGRAEAEARLELARVVAARAPGDAQDRRASAEARRAAALAPRWVEAQLAAAALEEDHGRGRRNVEAALRAVPEDPAALRALAQQELDQERPHAAARLLERAIRAAPGWAEPRVALSDALGRAGLDARAALLADSTARAFPTVPSAVRAAARVARQLGRAEEAAGRLRTLLALRFDDAQTRSALAQLLAERGDVAGAEELLAEALRLDPSDAWVRLRLADLLAANGRMDEAETAYGAALTLVPDEPDAWERRGRSRLAAGKARDAQADLQRALELKPQSTELKALARSLEPTREPYEKPYLLDAAALAAAAPAALPDEDALVLGDLKVTRVLPSGLSSTFTQTVVKVLTPRGADANRRQSLSWAPDRQEVRVERARVLKADGTVIETHDESEQSASEPWYRLYFDTTARTLSFPALSPGDVLEVAWRVEDVAGENLLSDYFGDLTFVDEPTRKARFEYVLLVPEARAIHANRPEGIAHAQRTLPGDVVEHRWSARDVARLVPEPGMPGWSEVSRSIHVSTYESWDQVARFYWGLVRDQVRPGPEVRAEAERIAAEALRERSGATRLARAQGVGVAAPQPPPGGWDRETRLALVRAVYGFVVSQTRYVGLEFGIHGYKPYRVDQVLQRRFGDCKDKASLLHALLESLGIDSRLVLLRMRHLGRLPEAPASLAVFNHAIVYVPDLDLWLDGTASFSGSRDLPDEDRGATVLVVNPGAAPRFTTIPEARPEENRIESRTDAAIAPDGSARLRGAWRVGGVEAPTYRRAYGAEDQRRALLEQLFNRAFPQVRVASVTISDLTHLEDDVTMEYALEVPRYARPDGRGLRFSPFAGARSHTDAWAALSARRHALEVGSPGETVTTYRGTLPPGWKVVELPDPASGAGPHASFDVRYRVENGTVVAESRIRVEQGRVPAADYAAFRELTARLDRALARKVRIAPAEAAR
jgi:tetratricopeptide (TPR) repeat protein